MSSPWLFFLRASLAWWRHSITKLRPFLNPQPSVVQVQSANGFSASEDTKWPLQLYQRKYNPFFSLYSIQFLIGHSTYLGHRSVLKWEPSSWGSEQRWQQQSKCHLRFKWFRRAKVWDRGRTYWLQISSPASIDLQDRNCSLKWFPFYLFTFWR